MIPVIFKPGDKVVGTFDGVGTVLGSNEFRSLVKFTGYNGTELGMWYDNLTLKKYIPPTTVDPKKTDNLFNGDERSSVVCGCDYAEPGSRDFDDEPSPETKPSVKEPEVTNKKLFKCGDILADKENCIPGLIYVSDVTDKGFTLDYGDQGELYDMVYEWHEPDVKDLVKVGYSPGGINFSNSDNKELGEDNVDETLDTEELKVHIATPHADIMKAIGELIVSSKPFDFQVMFEDMVYSIRRKG